MMGLFDTILKIDPLTRIATSKDPVKAYETFARPDRAFKDVQEELVSAFDGDKVFKGISTLGKTTTEGLEKAKVQSQQQAIDDYIALRDSPIDASKSPTVSRVSDIKSDLTGRLGALRAGREGAVEVRAQPQLQQGAETGAQATRGISGEGSRQFQQRAEIGTEEALANQQVEAQALSTQLQQEGGLQRLETEFTGFFNELAANRFSREISGLTEEMNKYLSSQGAKIGYDQLALEARKATSDMIGRFASSLGTEVTRSNRGSDRNISTPTTYYNSGSVTSKPSIFNS